MQVLENVNITKAQILAVFVSLTLFFFILNLIRKKSIKEEYSLLWISVSLIFIVFSVWREGLDFFARLVGVAYPPAALFLILLVSIFLILIEFSVIISKLSDRNKNLAQELGLLKHEVEKLKKEEQGY